MHSCHDDESVQNAVARFFDEFSEHNFFWNISIPLGFCDSILQCHIRSDYFLTNTLFFLQTCGQKLIGIFHIPIKTQIMQLNPTMGITKVPM